MSNQNNKSKIVFIVLAIIATVALVAVFYAYYQAQKEIEFLTSPTAQEEYAKQETADLIAKVKKHIVLPIDEEPLVANVLDAEKLKIEQPFYTDAKNGDKLVIYSTKAILYDAVNDILVNVGPVTIDGDLIKKIVTIDVRNGSQITGTAKTFATSLEEKGYKIGTVGNAANTNYKGTTLVNLKGKDLSALEKELGVTAIIDLPNGELISSADAVVIIGN
ncbi:MAG: LytR C-terminal domain-containing protein [Candidatus Gracilibacteria bacterium]|jgi:hypothetical protein